MWQDYHDSISQITVHALLCTVSVKVINYLYINLNFKTYQLFVVNSNSDSHQNGYIIVWVKNIPYLIFVRHESIVVRLTCHLVLCSEKCLSEGCVFRNFLNRDNVL